MKITNWRQPIKPQKITIQTQNTIIQIFKQKILVKEDQLKKRFFTPPTVPYQRNPKFPNPEQFGEFRDELEFFQIQFQNQAPNQRWLII